MKNMNEKLFNFIDDAYYINLDYRTDKNNIIYKHFTDIDIIKYIKRKSALTPLDLGYSLKPSGKYPHEGYSRACLYSHIEIIKKAKEQNLNNVLIFEDDAKFYYDGGYDPLIYIENALIDLNKIENWELFFLGTNPGENQTEFIMYGKNLVKISESIGTHAVLIRNTIFEKIIAEYETQYAFDIYLSNTFKEKYLAYPLCVSQRCGIDNDIGEIPYGGMCDDFWLKMMDKPINNNK